jgi:signal transduction histidine kinase
MEDLSLHILDVVENGVRANATEIHVEITENEEQQELTLVIEDNGKGMSEEMLNQASDPFFTTKGGKKIGLGLSLLSQSAEETGGTVTVTSKEGEGTRVTAIFKTDHIDMRPLGDIPETMSTLIAGNPDVRFILDYIEGETRSRFDSNE